MLTALDSPKCSFRVLQFSKWRTTKVVFFVDIARVIVNVVLFTHVRKRTFVGEIHTQNLAVLTYTRGGCVDRSEVIDAHNTG